jgi:hypothetical protein
LDNPKKIKLSSVPTMDGIIFWDLSLFSLLEPQNFIFPLSLIPCVLPRSYHPKLYLFNLSVNHARRSLNSHNETFLINVEGGFQSSAFPNDRLIITVVCVINAAGFIMSCTLGNHAPYSKASLYRARDERKGTYQLGKPMA